ncbi:hypothetical protein TraAM80_01169 [Trypanosoma rangeli]|uniref:Uncharacterized protein n=1 Tax=Trypanosoma rangeli TaxID=5698 RepID=A0A422NZW1_TRYRA|nr:uncharacterized protein TraAM80_01169 [Trypanosoma rangeli]RNF11042.1 hypothetical protein TraAM80_01169 [Trypanosoma rangeli]|eukprot:RNF11042.1 hypothetical protein TraAM80_01169 [Trypanosoma rangeli]
MTTDPHAHTRVNLDRAVHLSTQRVDKNRSAPAVFLKVAASAVGKREKERKRRVGSGGQNQTCAYASQKQAPTCEMQVTYKGAAGALPQGLAGGGGSSRAAITLALPFYTQSGRA